MKRSLILIVAGALAAGACNDQHDLTGNSNPGAELASTSGTKGINVALKGPATPQQIATLATYGNVVKQLPEIYAVLMSGDAANLDDIQALPFVAAANFDAERNAPPIDAVAAADFTSGFSTWNLDAVNVTNPGARPGSERTQSLDGTGVYVAILDTGLLPTWRQYFPEQRIDVNRARSFGGGAGPNGAVSEQPNKWEDDVNSHGTHVTSTVLGYSLSGTGINGVAPMVTIIPVKVLNQSGSGWSSAIAEGITYIGRLKAGELAGKPVVINMSLGGSVLDAVEQAALDYAIRQGVIIVASAGNSGEAGMGYPGAYQPVISVAATGWNRQWTCSTNTSAPVIGSWWNGCDVADPTNPADFHIAGFSSRQKAGQDLDVAAPGSWVVGPYQLNQSSRVSFFYLSGTSMASPHVAGIAALMAQKNPSLNAAQAEATLTGTAIPMGAGSAKIFDPNDGPITETWGTDATGSGLATADRALDTTVAKRGK
jgi:subtilisin family serine protease